MPARSAGQRRRTGVDSAGATGSVAVTGPTDTTAPQIDVEAPFSVTETQVHTLQAGDGPVVADNASVFVCYMGVNGPDGAVFDSSRTIQSPPPTFRLTQSIPGSKRRSQDRWSAPMVAVAMTSAYVYLRTVEPSAGIQPGDTLVFAIKILDAAR